MFRLVRLLTAALAFTLLAANNASAITASLVEKPASGLFGLLEQRVGIDALASAGRIDEKLSLFYDFASDFSVAARAVRTPTDRLAQHTKVSDLSGAARDVVGLPSGGQHLKEVSEAAGALRIRIEQINSGLSNPNLSSARRAELTAELAKANRNLDAAEQALTGVFPRHGP